MSDAWLCAHTPATHYALLPAPPASSASSAPLLIQIYPLLAYPEGQAQGQPLQPNLTTPYSPPISPILTDSRLMNLSVDQNETICRLVTTAGQRAYQSQRQQFDVFEKGLEDYVTDVDRALDRFLAEHWATLFPADGVITEENRQSCQTFQSFHSRLWFIDPIDGTAEYIHHGNGYAVMVGLLNKYRPQAGWIYAPAYRRLYWGGVGWGVFWAEDGGYPNPVESKRLAASDKFCRILLGYRDQERFGPALSARIPGLHCSSFGSFGLKVLEVIQGRAGLYLYLNQRVKLWDTVGPISLALAMGLRCCDLEGQPLRFDPSAINLQTLEHQQTIVVGWSDYIEKFLPEIRRAVKTVIS